jgi:hypothetical protein
MEIVVCGVPFGEACAREALGRLRSHGFTSVQIYTFWKDLEPEEGRFDWSWLDAPAQRWIARGKRIALRVTTSEGWLRYATPRWVFDAGARALAMLPEHRDKYTGEPSLEPDFGDPVYMEKLDRFLTALAARYDGDPHVEFVDIGTFGLWGEGHTWQGTRTHYPYPVLLKHLELHARHFRKTRLVVNDNHLDQDYAHPEMIQFCLERRMGIRNDSVCCVGGRGFRDITVHLMRAFWLTAPTVVEAGHYGITKNAMKTWRSEIVLDAVRELHASYCSIHGWPREFLAAERPLLDAVNRILGYRLQVTQASWPAEIAPHDPWRFQATWANAGVAPLYEDAWPALTLKDAQGGIAAVFVDEAMSLRRVLPAALGQSSPHRYAQESVFASTSRIRPGTYGLYVSAGSRQGAPRAAEPFPCQLDLPPPWPLPSRPMSLSATNSGAKAQPPRCEPVDSPIRHPGRHRSDVSSRSPSGA